MIKNNKGVTLVELLIVIVVMGIIAAFSIPAVGGIIENAKKDAILNDAIQVENAAKLYCSSTQCDADQELTWNDIKTYINGIPDDKYDFAVTGHTTNDTTVAELISGEWHVYLESVANPLGWEFPGGNVPSKTDRSDLQLDTAN